MVLRNVSIHNGEKSLYFVFWNIRTYVSVTVSTRKAFRTVTGVGINSVLAVSAVLARIRITVVWNNGRTGDTKCPCWCTPTYNTFILLKTINKIYVWHAAVKMRKSNDVSLHSAKKTIKYFSRRYMYVPDLDEQRFRVYYGSCNTISIRGCTSKWEEQTGMISIDVGQCHR